MKKKDGKQRLCSDYRALNKIIVKNRYLIPKINYLHDYLKGAKFFINIDYNSGIYHYVPIEQTILWKHSNLKRPF